jgi:hypothetical protein
MYNKDIEAKIASNDEFGNGDTKSTPLIITIVSLSKMIRLEIFTILTSQETMTLWVDG